jgi:putative glycosyltransferase (TIGR04372 family)
MGNKAMNVAARGKRFQFVVAVWGKPYLDMLLEVSLPSFMAPGNIPSCVQYGTLRFRFYTRPEDVLQIESHQSYRDLTQYAETAVLPLLATDQFENRNRYDVMALCHGSEIVDAVKHGAVLSVLSPDCVVSDGSLAAGCRYVCEGDKAVLVAGPRAELDSVVPILQRDFFDARSRTIRLSSRQLVGLAVRHLHPMSKILLWDAKLFSKFPSAVYWRAGQASLLARYFHLHPLFVDLAGARPEAARCGTVDGSLIQMAGIRREAIRVITDSDDIAVIELSRLDHDPMGSVPSAALCKTARVIRWAATYADTVHRDYFIRHNIRFQGDGDIDWARVEAKVAADIRIIRYTLILLNAFPGLFARVSVLRRRLARLCRLRRQRRSLNPSERGSDIVRHSSRLQGYEPYVKLGYWLTWKLGPSITSVLTRWLWKPALVALNIRHVIRDAIKRLKQAWETPDWEMPRNAPKLWQNFYESQVAPVRATRATWKYWPIYKLLVTLNVRFVVNAVPAMGHNTVELDYFFRRQKAGEVSPGTRYVLLRYPNSVHRDSVALYGHRFWLTPVSRWLYNFLLPVMMRYKDVTLDCGLSRLKWQLTDDLTFAVPPIGQTYLYQVSKQENLEAWKKYYCLRARTAGYFPLADGLKPDPELIEFLGGRTDNLALVHIKLHVVNATGAPSDPEAYLEAMTYLKQAGYRLVFVGREAMPEQFRRLGCLNYSESPIASYRHDLQIFSLAEIAITAGSGLALIPDCMGKPFVYLDSWHLGMPMWSSNCVMVPALVENRKTGERLSFSKQMRLYLSLIDRGHEVFPDGDYRARNASADEVLAAVKEVLAMKAHQVPRSPLQEQYCRLDPNDLLGLTAARVSEYFLLKHLALLGADGPSHHDAVASAGGTGLAP